MARAQSKSTPAKQATITAPTPRRKHNPGRRIEVSRPLRMKIVETHHVGRSVVPAALFQANDGVSFVIRYAHPSSNNTSLKMWCNAGKTFDTPVALMDMGIVNDSKAKFKIELLFPNEHSPFVTYGKVLGYQSWDVDEGHTFSKPRDIYIMPPGTEVCEVRGPRNLANLRKYQEIYPGAVLMTVSGKRKTHRIFVFIPGEPESAPNFANVEPSPTDSKPTKKSASRVANRRKTKAKTKTKSAKKIGTQLSLRRSK